MNKHFWRKIIASFGVALSGILITLSLASFAATSDTVSEVLEVYPLDTIAGYSTTMRTSKTYSDAEVVFAITKPDQEVLKVPAKTDKYGISKIEISDYYTREAGVYTVSASLSGFSVVSRNANFIVYPGSVSSDESVISPSEQVVQTSSDNAELTVLLRDDYGNPIEGHIVKLISSSDDDEISAVDTEISNENGEVSFRASSYETGSVTYTAYDVSSDTILNAKSKVVYFDDANYIFSSETPNSYNYAATGNSSGVIDHFEFTDIPNVINPNTSVNFTLEALDMSDQVVIDYDGTVRFSVLGQNSYFAQLPQDYTFLTEDLGTHTFSLALSFQQPGVYEIEARDIDSPDILGTYSFTVIEAGSTAPTDSSVVLSSPLSGTYSTPMQTVSGRAPSGSSLKIFDGSIEIGAVVADVAGSFSFNTGSLGDGLHIITVGLLDTNGTVLSLSDSVEINIDTGEPEISQVVIEPSLEVNPNTTVTVKLYVAEQLSQAALLVNNNIYELSRSVEGFYSGSFVAPIEFGVYDLTFILVDQLGNESRVSGEYSINVGGVAPGNSLLSDVAELTAASADRRVILNWSAPSVSAKGVKNYRVYYGLSPNQLTEVVDTFTNAPTWYVPALRNGVEYYFAVVAVDEEGNVSEHFSNIVSAMPGGGVTEVVPPEVVSGAAGEEAIEEMESDVSDTGPEMSWLILLSALGGIGYCQFAKKRREIGEIDIL